MEESTKVLVMKLYPKYCYDCGKMYTSFSCPECSSTTYTKKPNSQTIKRGVTNAVIQGQNAPKATREHLVGLFDGIKELFDNDWVLINTSTLKSDINDDCETINSIEQLKEAIRYEN